MATSQSISKTTITAFWDYLKDTLVVPDIASKLIEHNVLSPSNWMDLKKNYSGSDMTETFLYILFEQKTSHYVNFVKALIDAGRSDVVDVLEGRTGLYSIE